MRTSTNTATMTTTTTTDFAVKPWQFSDSETLVVPMSDRAKAWMVEQFGSGAASFFIGLGSLEQWAERMQNRCMVVTVERV